MSAQPRFISIVTMTDIHRIQARADAIPVSIDLRDQRRGDNPFDTGDADSLGAR